MREYESCFALLIRDFIAYRKASGRWNEASYGPNLRVFDRFCAMNYPDSVHLTQEMVDRWCRQRDSETNNSCRSRIYVVYSFIKYLSERGLSEVLPPRIPRKERVTYIPYAFSGDEIRSFFKACDNLPDIPKTRNVLIRRITVPVLFRLLYSSGIRTTEARLLECADVDVGNGILNIRYSKGHDQHYIALHDSMADLMRRYDSAIREWFPSRKYFSRHQGTPRIHIHGWRKISGGYGRKCPMTEQPQRMRSGIIMQQQISTAGSGTGLLLTISSPASAKAWGIRHWRAHGITILSFPAFPISS